MAKFETIQREASSFQINEVMQKRIQERKCPACGKPKSEWNRRTDWTCCSKKCTEKFLNACSYYDWNEMRKKVFGRDKGRCNDCKRQFITKTKILYSIEEYEKSHLFLGFEDGNAIFADDYKLIADHIVPIAVGGKQWDMSNIQTLCAKCNKEKTRRDHKLIADYRRFGKSVLNTEQIKLK